MDIEKIGPDHTGGQLLFDSDGLLFIITGDGFSEEGDAPGNAQSKMSLLGKVLRIDVDRGEPYAIPPDNPFAKGGGKGEIFALGLRNPWRCSLDQVSHLFFCGDNGVVTQEEIDLIEIGKNYGWNVMEGTACFQPTSGCKSEGLTLPFHKYAREHGTSVIGGYVYRGKKLGNLKGAYVYGDFGSRKIWALFFDENSKQVQREELLTQTKGQIVSFGEDSSKELYVMTFEGELFRLERNR